MANWLEAMMPPSPGPLTLRYAGVPVAVLASLVLRWLLWPVFGYESPFLFLWPTVVFCAWYGGLGPGLLATALSALSVVFFLLEPALSPTPLDSTEVLRLASFLLLGSCFALLMGRVQQANRRADAERERLQVTLNGIGEGVITTNAKGEITFLNDAAGQLTGCSPHETLGRPLDAVFRTFHEQTRLPAPSPVLQVLQTGDPVGLANPTVLIARDGAERAIESSAAPLRGAGGALLGSILVFRDVSQRRAAEVSLQANERRYRSLTDSVPGIIYEYDLVTNTVLRTGGLLAVVGYRPEEALTSPVWWSELIHPEDQARVMEQALEALAHGDRVALEYRVKHKDGHYIHVQDRARAIRAPNGRVLRLVGCSQDVTSLKLAEERYRFLADCVTALATTTLEYEATLQMVARLAVPTLADHCLVHLKEEDGSARQVAEAHAELGKGPAPAEVARACRPGDGDSPIQRVIHTGKSERTPEVGWADRQASAGGDRKPPDEGSRPPSGIHVPLVARGRTVGCLTLLAAGPGRYRDEHLLFAEELAQRAGLALDNARLYRDVQETDHRKDVFLATLSHELRNPLEPIVNALELLRLGGPTESAANQARDVIERQVRQLIRLVDDLLDVARINQGKIRLRKQVLDLKDVVTQAVETCRPLLLSRQHELTVSLPSAAVRLEADPTRLAQVLGNLLTNAGRYTPTGGHITLMGESRDSTLILRVRDDGVGIPADMLPHVFDLFTQVQRSTEVGLGIGLSLVKTLVELHGGRVGVTSPGQTRGCEFWISLPILCESPEAAGEPPTSPLPAEGLPAARPSRRVLVVDDNEDAAFSLQVLLEMWGHTVQVAHDGPEALELARQFQPEVALLDIGLPGPLSGHDLARLFRQQGLTDTLLIALTGYGQDEDRNLSRLAGMDYHCVKPVDPEVLQRLLAERRANPGACSPLSVRDEPQPADPEE